MEEGPLEGFFVVADDFGGASLGDSPTPEVSEEAFGAEDHIPDAVLHATGQSKDIALVLGMGFMVDNDNKPSPENIPSPEPTQGDENHIEAVWVF